MSRDDVDSVLTLKFSSVNYKTTFQELTVIF